MEVLRSSSKNRVCNHRSFLSRSLTIIQHNQIDTIIVYRTVNEILAIEYDWFSNEMMEGGNQIVSIPMKLSRFFQSNEILNKKWDC